MRTIEPFGTVYDAVGSQFVQRTPPDARVFSTRLPVAGKSPETSTGISIACAGIVRPAAFTAVAAGSAVTVSDTGPTGSIRGVTVIWADGSTRAAATPLTARARTRIRIPAMTPAPGPRRRGFASGTCRPRRTISSSSACCSGSSAGTSPRACARPAAEPPPAAPAPGCAAMAAAAAGAAAADVAASACGGVAVTTLSRPSSSAASYSPTDANTGRPAEAASARAEASGATMSSRRPFACASRASSRKLIRDVATRDPKGSTRPTRVPSAVRMRVAAEVISSSGSR